MFEQQSIITTSDSLWHILALSLWPIGPVLLIWNCHLMWCIQTPKLILFYQVIYQISGNFPNIRLLPDIRVVPDIRVITWYQANNLISGIAWYQAWYLISGYFGTLISGFGLIVKFGISLNATVQISPLTVTLVRVTHWLQWHLFGLNLDHLIPKVCWLEWHSAYSDTFSSYRRCHCNRGRLYRDSQKDLYVVARALLLLLLNCSAWPCLGPA